MIYSLITLSRAEEGEMPKKQEYLLLMELQYKTTNENEHKHDLGVFEKMTRSYCTACVAGQGACCHGSERLCYQYHWT